MKSLTALAALLATTGERVLVSARRKHYCPGCVVVDHARAEVPPPTPGTRTEVVLVHGAFGFGEEWAPVIAAVRQAPHFDLLAWSWPGPFRHPPPKDARALAAELQALLDGLPPTVDEIIVLAHSAGGLITNLAMRQLRIPPGRHVTVALLDPVFFRLANPAQYHALPAGMTATVFYAQDPPRHPSTEAAARHRRQRSAAAIRRPWWTRSHGGQAGGAAHLGGAGRHAKNGAVIFRRK